MNETTLICRDEQRRHVVRASEKFNGLDYLEIGPDQRTLIVYLLRKASDDLVKKFAEPDAKRRILISGGRRIREIVIEKVKLNHLTDPNKDDYLEIVLHEPGDFSVYTLQLVELEAGKPTDRPMDYIDPRYDRLQFSFKADCPSDLDCKSSTVCPPPARTEPEINYLAKDYASFRQLILDRLSQIMPGWQERHVPDLGITLVEILAYAGDYLSYYQDAVAAEAYLDTARQRISVRRHARLVDYPMHEGCNARTWVAVAASQDISLDPKEVFFITHPATLSQNGVILSSDDLQNISSKSYEVFEPLVETPPLRRFTLDDLKNPAGLATKWREGQDALSQYIRGRLSAETIKLLNQYDGSTSPSSVLQKALIDELNRLLEAGNFYRSELFPNPTPETQKLLAQKPEGENLMHLNRWLLEEAYRQELAWSPRGYLYLYAAHNEIYFYTWGDLECCLPRGATTATLRDEWVDSITPGNSEPKQQASQTSVTAQTRGRKLQLKVGDVLIFEEVLGPKTGDPADANPNHRHAVHLTRVKLGVDELCDQPIVEIEWGPKDKLPFPLCISVLGPAPDCTMLKNISVVRGNVVLADHGRWVVESLGSVGATSATPKCHGRGELEETILVPEPFRPRLKNAPWPSGRRFRIIGQLSKS